MSRAKIHFPAQRAVQRRRTVRHRQRSSRRRILRARRRTFVNIPPCRCSPGLKDIDVRDAHQTIVIGSADPQTADFCRSRSARRSPNAAASVIDEKGMAIYVADIIYRSDVIKLHIDLLANTRAAAAASGPRSAQRLEQRSEARRAPQLQLNRTNIRIIEP